MQIVLHSVEDYDAIGASSSVNLRTMLDFLLARSSSATKALGPPEPSSFSVHPSAQPSVGFFEMNSIALRAKS